MTLHLNLWEIDTIYKDKWQDRHHKAVEKKISKKAHADSTDDEKCARAPGKTHWL